MDFFIPTDLRLFMRELGIMSMIEIEVLRKKIGETFNIWRESIQYYWGFDFHTSLDVEERRNLMNAG
jgi:hypothetical protein